MHERRRGARRRCSRRPRATARSRRRPARPRPRRCARVVGDDERDRVADEPHLAVGERRPRGLRALLARSTVCHCSLASALRSAAVNTNAHAGRLLRVAASRSPRIAARANGLRTKYACSIPGSDDVVDVRAVPGQQAGVLDAVDPRADVSPGVGLACVPACSHDHDRAAAVDRDDRAGDERCAVRAQERRRPLRPRRAARAAASGCSRPRRDSCRDPRP